MNTSNIHPTAVISATARIDESVRIGAHCVIGEHVEIGADTVLHSHVVIESGTIGQRNTFSPFSCIGGQPEDMKFQGEHSQLTIGDDNTIREHVIIHRGTKLGGGITRVGCHNHIMTSSHIAHDCIVGNHTIIGHASAVAGHVQIDDWAVLSGCVGVIQFSHIGTHAFIGGGSVVNTSILAYITARGSYPIIIKGINREGLQRRNFNREQIALIFKAYRIIYKKKLAYEEIIEQLHQLSNPELIQPLIEGFSHFAKLEQR